MLNMTGYSINANSYIEGNDVAYFNANYSRGGNFSINMNVNNKNAYDENKIQVDSDFEQFKNKVDEYAKSFNLVAE